MIQFIGKIGVSLILDIDIRLRNLNIYTDIIYKKIIIRMRILKIFSDIIKKYWKYYILVYLIFLVLNRWSYIDRKLLLEKKYII